MLGGTGIGVWKKSIGQLVTSLKVQCVETIILNRILRWKEYKRQMLKRNGFRF